MAGYVAWSCSRSRSTTQAVEWEGVDRQGRRVTHDLNLFSRMVSLALRRVQWDWLAHHPPRFPDLPYHIELVISYCERAHHDGTGYRASGFTRWGLSRDGTKAVYYRRLRRSRKRWRPARCSILCWRGCRYGTGAVVVQRFSVVRRLALRRLEPPDRYARVS